MAWTCPRCGGKTANVARYCMHCGKSLREVRGDTYAKKKIDELCISDDINVAAFLTKLMGRSLYWQTVTFHQQPTVREIQGLIDRFLTDRQRQLFIRSYGLDGKPPRRAAQIAKEADVSTDQIYSQLREARARFTRALSGENFRNRHCWFRQQ